jgi:2-polyprenyl-6-methoxyphenol hydroxylase-like FAD-dependent oxidoreductase
MVPQDVTEKLLAEELVRRGGAVEYETSFVTAVERDGRVSATLDRKGEREEITAAFVVGCDGAHSTIRHLLDLPFEGAAYDALFILADIQTNDALPADELQLCPSEFGPAAIFPMSATRRRVVATVERAWGEVPSLDLVRQILSQRAPAGIEAQALHWSSYFRIHHRHAARLRVGRMFIAGDAAHIHSPFGGQGMNTGLHDAWNLAWKLDLALRGRGNETLLGSYEAERLPVIRHVIETTHRLTKAQTLRDAVIPVVSRLPPFQHAFVQTLSGLGIAYRGSPIVEGPGERYFDDGLRGGTGIKSRFLLVAGDAADPAARESAARLAESLSEVVELRQGPGGGIRLVRPDGYVAFAANAADGNTVNAVRTLLERQTN